MVGAAEEAGQFSLADAKQQPEESNNTIPIVAPPIVRPGESIYLHGLLYSAAPPPNITAKDFKHIAPLYDSQKVSIGLLLDLGEEGQLSPCWGIYKSCRSSSRVHSCKGNNGRQARYTVFITLTLLLNSHRR